MNAISADLVVETSAVHELLLAAMWFDSLLAMLGSVTVTAPPPTYGYKLVATYPHDSGAFCQGLYFEHESGKLLESTGLYGESSVRRVDYKTGRILQQQHLPIQWFGEGLTLCGGRPRPGRCPSSSRPT